MQKYKNLVSVLTETKSLNFINEHLTENAAQLALKYSKKVDHISTLVELIKLYQKAENKLPLWVQHRCALTARAFEQSTSQAVAQYKATLFKGGMMLNLSGGLGVDDWAFSASFNSIISIDIDNELNELVVFNNVKINSGNIKRVNADAETFLNETGETFDLVYADPDRRDEKGQRIITLKDSSPNVITLLPKIFEHTAVFVIKASPLISIDDTVKELQHMKEVRVIAWKNEVKEVLFTLQKGYEGNYVSIAANYETNTGWQEFTGMPLNEIEISHEAGACFFEPNVAIIKAGLHHACALAYGLSGLDRKTAYYTAARPVEGFPGRQFSIVSSGVFSKKEMLRYLTEKGIKKANIARRNFRLSAEEVKQQLKLNDGGDEYLFFTQKAGKPWYFHVRKL